jgi:hypothetical protein
MTTPLPPSLVGKVVDVVVEVNSPEDLAPGLERVLGIPLDADEVAYLEDLGRRVLVAILAARPQ